MSLLTANDSKQTALLPPDERPALETDPTSDDKSSLGKIETSSSSHEAHEQSAHDAIESINSKDDPTTTERDPELALSRTETPQWSIFTHRQKSYIVATVAMAGFFSPLSANIYFPALNTLADDFNVTPSTINLTLTTYMIFQGLAPTVFGDLSDMAGRRPAYMIAFTVYLGACIGLANCKTFAALLVLRCLQSSGSSGTIALASGVVADVATSADRGIWMAWANCGPMIAPPLAPIIGGLFAQYTSWRWIFWFLVILAVTFLIPFLTTFPETGRNVVGNGSIPPQGWNKSLLNIVQTHRHPPNTTSLPPRRKLRFPNPLKVLPLLLEKDVALLLIYNSLIYSAFYDVMASFPYLLQLAPYNYNPLQIGLCFIPFGFGCLIAQPLSGRLMDWKFRQTAAKINYKIVKGKANDLQHFPLEQVRIAIALPFVLIGTAALLAYGWTMQYHAPLPVPLILQFTIGLNLTSAFNAMSVMLIDFYPLSPATATSANNLVRCLMGAGATAVVIQMIEAMGVGWCFTFVAGVVAITTPTLWVLGKWGPGWREGRRVRMQEQIRVKKAKAEAKEVEKRDG
ncbi:hypothetical protein LTR95_004512 [Oleoguttula sp. CCFEE 5521]